MLRLFFAIFVAKFAALITRVFGAGHGSSLPGFLAEKIYPQIAVKLSAKFKRGVILVTGTNGKTTTARLISNIFSSAGFSKIHNQTGANLVRGVVSALTTNASLGGKINADFGLFEIDEATLPEAVKKLNPKIIIFNNLFRDQLDRYGEVDKISRVWKKSLEQLPLDFARGLTTQIILNIDDPSVAALANYTKGSVLTFGFEDKNLPARDLPAFADAIFCSKCLTKFQYKKVYLSHLGEYFCPKCGNSRQIPEIFASEIKLNNADNIGLKINFKTELLDSASAPLEEKNNTSVFANVKLFGLYNAYNALAASACGLALKIPIEKIKQGLETFTPAFGRFEKTNIEKTPATLFLIKNPTGATEVIHALAQNFSTRSPRRPAFEEKKKNLFIIFNDNIPDGCDVSWIWDTDWENIVPYLNFVVISGKRAEEMVLRLKYAGLAEQKMILEKDYKKALEIACEKSGTMPLHILPNYSAMYDLRNYLAHKKYLSKII